MVTEMCQFLVESRADHVPVHARHCVRIDSKNENGGHVRQDDQLPSLVPEAQHCRLRTEALRGRTGTVRTAGFLQERGLREDQFAEPTRASPGLLLEEAVRRAVKPLAGPVRD